MTRLLITGASGNIGTHLVERLPATGFHSTLLYHTVKPEAPGFRAVSLDVSSAPRFAELLEEEAPDVIVHLAAIASAHGFREQPELARELNVGSVGTICSYLEKRSAHVIFPSSDLVFSGEKGNYAEGDPVDPTTLYGEAKAEAERLLHTRAAGRSTVLRFSLLYGKSTQGHPMFVDRILASLRSSQPVSVFHDEWRTPLPVTAAAEAILGVIRCIVSSAGPSLPATMHVGGPERVSRHDFALRVADFLGAPSSSLVPVARSSLQGRDRRPGDVSLDSSLWRSLFPELPWPSLRQGFETFLERG